MSNTKKSIPDDEWRTIVANVPLVSVDLVIKHDDGILLGKRQNEPAKGEWFVPGGRVQKNESRTDAVHRIAQEEISCEVEIGQPLGTFEHFYDTSDVPGVDTKHYLANGFAVTPKGEPSLADEQHKELRTFSEPFPELHPYVEQYLEELD